jgi:hypothetical protein
MYSWQVKLTCVEFWLLREDELIAYIRLGLQEFVAEITDSTWLRERDSFDETDWRTVWKPEELAFRRMLVDRSLLTWDCGSFKSRLNEAVVDWDSKASEGGKLAIVIGVIYLTVLGYLLSTSQDWPRTRFWSIGHYHLLVARTGIIQASCLVCLA